MSKIFEEALADAKKLKEVAEELIPGFADKLNERLESKKLPALPVY